MACYCTGTCGYCAGTGDTYSDLIGDWTDAPCTHCKGTGECEGART